MVRCQPGGITTCYTAVGFRKDGNAHHDVGFTGGNRVDSHDQRRIKGDAVFVIHAGPDNAAHIATDKRGHFSQAGKQLRYDSSQSLTV